VEILLPLPNKRPDGVRTPRRILDREGTRLKKPLPLRGRFLFETVCSPSGKKEPFSGSASGNHQMYCLLCILVRQRSLVELQAILKSQYLCIDTKRISMLLAVLNVFLREEIIHEIELDWSNIHRRWYLDLSLTEYY